MKGKRTSTICVLITLLLGLITVNRAFAKPEFRYVEVNGERVYGGNTVTATQGDQVKFHVAAKEPHDFAIKCEVRVTGPTGDYSSYRCERVKHEGIYEYFEYTLDTSGIAPDTYKIRIISWSDTQWYEGRLIEKETVEFPDFYLNIESKEKSSPVPTGIVIPVPWEAVIMGLTAGFLVIVLSRRETGAGEKCLLLKLVTCAFLQSSCDPRRPIYIPRGYDVYS